MDSQIFGETVVVWLYQIPVTATMVTSLAISLVLVGIALALRAGLTRSPTGTLAALALLTVEWLDRLVRDVAGRAEPALVTLAGSLFLFIAACNLSGQLPGVRPPTASLATASALAAIVFLAVPVAGIRARGVRGYLLGYLRPNPLLAPLHVISELSRTLVVVETNDTRRFTIEANGEVGIGTDDPSQTLHVNGNTLMGGRLYPGSTNNLIHIGDTAVFDGASGWNPPGSSSSSLFIEQGNGEGSGICLDGNTIAMWSPGNGDRLLSIYDEDGMTLEFYIRDEGTVVANGVTLTSSRVFKTDIAPIAGALEKVKRLEGVTFNWIEDKGGEPGIGFIAEDLYEVFPELVLWEEGAEHATGVNYANVTAVNLEAIKELDAKVDAADAAQALRMAALERENAGLKERLAALERLVGGLAAGGDKGRLVKPVGAAGAGGAQ